MPEKYSTIKLTMTTEIWPDPDHLVEDLAKIKAELDKWWAHNPVAMGDINITFTVDVGD